MLPSHFKCRIAALPRNSTTIYGGCQLTVILWALLFLGGVRTAWHSPPPNPPNPAPRSKPPAYCVSAAEHLGKVKSPHSKALTPSLNMIEEPAAPSDSVDR